MKIPMPFPKCNSCGEAAPKSYHRNCGGRMEIETTTDVVYCSKCNSHWNVWDTTYYCTCGSAFKATAVRAALVEVLACCRVCAEEIIAQQQSQKKREKYSELSIKSFLCKFFEQLGYSFGVAIGTIIEAATKFILK